MPTASQGANFRDTGGSMTLNESHAELLAFVVAERDCFYECCSNNDGIISDPNDVRELEEIDAIIDRAQKAAA
jgi:hypothetical protein